MDPVRGLGPLLKAMQSMSRRELAVFLAGLSVPALAHPRRAAFAALTAACVYAMTQKNLPSAAEPGDDSGAGSEEGSAEAASAEPDYEFEEDLLDLAESRERHPGRIVYSPDVEHLGCVLAGIAASSIFHPKRAVFLAACAGANWWHMAKAGSGLHEKITAQVPPLFRRPAPPRAPESAPSLIAPRPYRARHAAP